MRVVVKLALLVSCVLSVAAAQSELKSRNLQITTSTLPLPIAGKRYVAQLSAVGGTPPYHWSLVPPSHLPPGLSLDERTGIISGRLRPGMELSITVQVQDSSEPPLTHSKQLVATDNAPLEVKWTDLPRISGNTITGAALARNGGKNTLDLTVIVVAVNETGKAFALRYERLPLPPGEETPALAFTSTLPLGQYTVHVDAVGEDASRNVIYRDRHELQGLVVDTQ